MATDISVQYFSHLNGLVLGNNWGDLIRLLDSCLVNGLSLPNIGSAAIDANGDINLTFVTTHSCMLFQIIELTGFAPSNFNAKYRIKGIPSTTQLILKTEFSGQAITTIGTAKLSSLGYEIIFRDTGDVKRVYRAKNPRAEHPFIRIDETISDGTNTYSSSYAKSAMVGLIENMTHIDDYQDTSKLQLPLDTGNFKKNWSISGTGSSVTRGWVKWYYASNYYNAKETDSQTTGNRNFTFIGDQDAFYLLNSQDISNNNVKRLNSCGLINAALTGDVIPNWFLMATLNPYTAQDSTSNYNAVGFSPLCYSANASKFFTTKYNLASRIGNHVYANPVIPDYQTGYSGKFGASSIPALEIPFFDDGGFLRGSLKHVAYSGKNIRSYKVTTPLLGNASMYIADSIYCNANSDTGAIYFYLGELE